MGKYINEDQNGAELAVQYRSKIYALVKGGAKIIDTPTEWKEGLCCAVDNFTFGAVAYAYDEQEMEAFKRDVSGRPKTWLYIENAKDIAK